MDPLNILSRPARIAFLVVLLAMGGIAVFVFVEATWHADGQAGLVFVAAPVYSAVVYAVIAAVDVGVRAIGRRLSGRGS